MEQLIAKIAGHSLKTEVASHGFALLREFLPATEAIAVANALGQPLMPWEGGIVQNLVPRGSAAPNTYSGIYGFDRFPFHTDLAHWRTPPRYLLLRCLIGYADVPTLLVDGQAILNTITRDVLTRAIFRPRRPRDGELTLLRLCEPTCTVPCDSIAQRIWRLSAARDVMKQLYQHLGA